MATVPGVLILGDSHVQGGIKVAANTSSIGATALTAFYDAKVMRITPSSDSTGAPTCTSLSWYPWFDGLAGATNYQVASATSTTITVSPSPSWTTNQWAGKVVSVINTTTIGFMQRVAVVSNTANTLTVAAWTGGTPSVGQYFFLQQGRWRDYHAAAGYIHPTELGLDLARRGGSSWAALGLGVGPDAGLIREFLESTWTTAPYFQLAKYAHVQKTVGNWDTAGATRTAFETFVSEMASAWTALANGNTLSWELVILDQSQLDVVNWASTPGNYLLYEASLTAMLSYLRTALSNASLKILIVNHDNTINAVTTPSGTLLANRIHRSVAAADGNARVVSMQGLRTIGTTDYAVASENQPYYASAEYWTNYARKARESYELMAAGAAEDYAGALPTYLLIGDSIAVGSFNSTYTNALGSPTLTSGPRSAAQIIFNAQNGEGEPYDVGDNSNTSGTTGINAGPECSMMVDLEQLHPTGVMLIKRGSNSSALIGDFAAYTGSGSSGGRWSKSYAATEHYDELVDLFSAARAYAHETLGKQLDLKAIFVMLGTNDGAETDAGELFAAEIATFVADLRADFSTRTSGDDLPIVWRKPQLDTATAITDEMVAIRAALEAYALTDEKFALVNVDDLERLSSDNIHETPESAITNGQRMVAAMAAIAI